MDRMTNDYKNGFLSRCAELGVPGDVAAGLLKRADPVHTVSSGEALSRIAKRYGVTVQQLIAANGIRDPNRIRVGQRLKIPGKASAAPVAAPAKPASEAEHVVASGDALSRIAKSNGVTVQQLMEANGIKDPNRIRVGQRLKIPAAAKPVEAKPVASKPAAGPVGFRQNNPGNLRSDGKTKWVGADVPSAGKFLTFDTPESGIRALSRVWMNYGKRHGIDTLEKGIARFAPAVENDTSSYLRSVQAKTGFRPGEKLDFTKQDTLQRLIPAIGLYYPEVKRFHCLHTYKRKHP